MKKSRAGVAAVAAALIAAPGFAADLSRPMYTKAPPPSPVLTWNGCYGGVTGGGVWSRTELTTDADPDPAGFSTSAPLVNAAGTHTIDQTGGTLGGEIGCNYQYNSFVIGAESDIQWTGIHSTLNTTITIPAMVNASQSVTSDWLATFRARAGIANGNWLFYVTGGGAIANPQFSDTFGFPFSATFNTASVSGTRLGWAAGAGLEWMIMPRVSVKGEYLHVDLGNVSRTSANSNPIFPTALITVNHNLTEDIGRVGINYHF